MNDQNPTPSPLVREPAGGTLLPTGLVGAYLTTDYRVFPSEATEGFTLRIGETSTELQVLMKRFARCTAAFITAWNPLGQSLPDEENLKRNVALRQALLQRSLPHWPGIGVGTEGDWPGEESFLVLGLDLEAARRLATEFSQNAFVWTGTGSPAELVLLK